MSNKLSPQVVLIYSGGLDSSVLLSKLVASFDSDEIVALNFNYGSKHNTRERHAAKQVCERLGVELVEINLPFVNELFKSDLLSSGAEIPDGHYEAESMKKTVVPFRNGIMLSIAAGYAESVGAKKVAIASHRGDRCIYPDCRREFTEAMSIATQLGTSKNIQIISPFNNLMKWDIVRIGLNNGAPFHLTWSCYKGTERPCLSCGTCQERAESFYKNYVQDPALSIEEWEEALKIIKKN